MMPRTCRPRFERFSTEHDIAVRFLRTYRSDILAPVSKLSSASASAATGFETFGGTSRLLKHLASVRVGLWEWDVADDRVSWSENVEELFGLPSGAFGQTYDAYLGTISPEDRPMIARYVEEVMTGKRDNYEIEHRIVWPDGSVHWIGCTARATRDDTGKLARLGGTVLDVTRRNSAENAVREIEERFRSAMALSPLGMSIATPDGKLLEVSPAFCRLLGYTRDELLALDLRTITVPDDLPSTHNMHAKLLSSTEQAQIEKRYLHKDGHPVWVHINAAAVCDAENKPRYFVAQIQDITERRAAEKALRTSEEILRQVTENLREVVWMVDIETGTLLYISPAFERVFSMARGDDLNELMARWLAAIHPDDRAMVVAKTSEPTVEQDMTYRLLDPGGNIRWIHCRTFPIREPGRNIRRVVGVAEDITERRRIEEHLQHAQKMDAFGQLAGGVAHDFNNLLAVILPHSELASRTRDLSPTVAESLTAIENAARRAAALTRQLLQLGRREVLQPTDLDLNETVSSFASMLRRVLREDVNLQVTLAPALPVVSADPNMMGQVMMNLALNARDAMPDGGTLALTTSKIVLDEDGAHRIDGAHAGTYSCVEVSDTGHGIDPAHQERLFEPFFTTKPPGKGTGLGLATVRGIVFQHGGCISVASAVGHGTQFRILLPSVAGTRVQAPKAGAIESRGGNEKVLVVEDEAAVRRTTVLVLEAHGYQVMSAVDAVDALEILRTHGNEIALVITDLVMPGATGGLELVSQIVERWPEIHLVLMSGYSPDMFGRKIDLRTGDQFLSKPVEIDRLLEVVRAGIDRTHA
jgi:two-component system, cell cycle sensor histidine kinase and response regulator CckA